MEDIKDVWLGPMPADSIYLKPFRLHYTQNGSEKTWDLLKVHDSVCIILYNVTRKKLLFVKQFRPAVLMGMISSTVNTDKKTASSIEQKQVIDLNTFQAKEAITVELCSGLVDKPVGIRQIAAEEVLEECGYKVPEERLEEIMTYR